MADGDGLTERIRPGDTAQIPLAVKYETKPVWTPLRSLFGVNATGAAIALAAYEAALIGDGMVSYSRSRNYYDARSNNPLLTYRKVIAAVDHLEDRCLIQHFRQVPGGRGWQSAFRATPVLLEALGSLLGEIPRLPLAIPHVNVILRDGDGRAIDMARTRALDREVRKMGKTVVAINKAIASVEVVNDNSVNMAAPVMRIFNRDPGLTRGGRFYAMGTSWQNVPRQMRRRVQMDGEAVVELDFVTLHPAMLYAEIGAPLPEDCYVVGNWLRSLVKRAFLILINATNVRSARLAIAHCDEMHGLAYDHQQALEAASRLIDDIKAAHRPIANAFHSDAGARLMRKDSDIAEAVMLELLEQGIVALPVHDSFLVPMSKRDQLELAMRRAAYAAGLHVRVTDAS